MGLSVAGIAQSCGVPLHEAEAVLARLQQVEPAGLFARPLARFRPPRFATRLPR
ncbi:hypothetical protein [Frigidibacter sp.]|uniref:RNA polymerase factor sigma-54 n=1 Tax=Frigidibacter sp. TaxID=2586418 RepID=UPI00352355D9